MKKLFSFLLCLVSLASFGQSQRWFFSITPGITVGGPAISIKSQMKEQGFGDYMYSSFLTWGGNSQFPKKQTNPSLLFRAGKNITGRRSVYFVAGLASSGTVKGFHKEGTADFFFISGDYGKFPEVSYSLFQFTGGFLYASSNSKAKLGFGPSVFLFTYSMDQGEKTTHPVPGITGTVRLPFGKEKRTVGLELVMETNLLPPVTMKNKNAVAGDFKPGKVNLANATVGLSLCFRGHKS